MPRHPRRWPLLRRAFLAALLLAAVAGLPAACRRDPPPREYPISGHILAVNDDGSEVTISHDEIAGFMPAMTMPLKVREKSVGRTLKVGDLVKGTLLVTDEESWLARLERTGWAPFARREGAGRPEVEVLEAGEQVPDETFIDQDGNAVRLSDLKGTAVLVTFVYTRCPLPDFCPRMDRKFAAVQRAVKDGVVPGKVRLLSVSFDPDYDTPAVLREHAARQGADPKVWTYVTAPKDRVDAFGARLGLDVMRNPENAFDITHNLRTAVVDRDGRLVTVLNGNEWTPDEAIRALGGRI